MVRVASHDLESLNVAEVVPNEVLLLDKVQQHLEALAGLEILDLIQELLLVEVLLEDGADNAEDPHEEVVRHQIVLAEGYSSLILGELQVLEVLFHELEDGVVQKVGLFESVGGHYFCRKLQLWDYRIIYLVGGRHYRLELTHDTLFEFEGRDGLLSGGILVPGKQQSLHVGHGLLRSASATVDDGETVEHLFEDFGVVVLDQQVFPCGQDGD